MLRPRLEKLADPGGICISGIVFDQVKGKLDAGFEEFGFHHVKNIADPIRTYRVTAVSVSNVHVGPISHPTKPSIAVLPFDNMSDDHAQEYFSDGISEDLTTALSRVSNGCSSSHATRHSPTREKRST
jgi:adenylate cyclase